MSRIISSVYLIILVFPLSLTAQSFYKEKNPKTISYQLGLGAGTFLSAPRPSYDSIINEKLPTLSIGLGKRLGSHLSIHSNFSVQPFSSKEYIPREETELSEIGNGTTEPIFSGFSYAFDLVPTVNLLPSFHHMSRPIVNLSLGVGLGYLLTYRTEKFFFNEKFYEFNLFESSMYIPVRASLSVRLGLVTNLNIEGVFFNTFLDDDRSITKIQKNSDHLGQLNLVFQRFIR